MNAVSGGGVMDNTPELSDAPALFSADGGSNLPVVLREGPAGKDGGNIGRIVISYRLIMLNFFRIIVLHRDPMDEVIGTDTLPGIDEQTSSSLGIIGRSAETHGSRQLLAKDCACACACPKHAMTQTWWERLHYGSINLRRGMFSAMKSFWIILMTASSARRTCIRLRLLMKY